MPTTNDAVLLVDWLNLSIHVKGRGFAFGADLLTDLLELADKECARHAGARLARAHFVGERFSAEVESKVEATLIAELHKTRTAKEQADLKLAVLAMDHVHDDRGCPRLFLLATGDQDFVPLIERIVKAEAKVVLIVASTDNLAPEYRAIAAQANVSLVSLTDILSLAPIPTVAVDHSARTVLGLLKLCMNGGILGGDQTRNTQLMTEWGLLSDDGSAEVEMEGAIRQFGRTETRTVAVPAKYSNGNSARQAKRTTLNFSLEVVSRAIADADWVLRRINASGAAPARGSLGVGRFAEDDGRDLDRALASLTSVGWLVERPDGTFESQITHASDGLIEPLWRVVAEVNRRAYEQRSDGVDRDSLFNDLRNGPIAHVPERKGGTAAKHIIDLARRVGVIDSVHVPPDGYRLKVIESHPLCRQVAEFLKTLGRLAQSWPTEQVPEHEILRMMREHDERATAPLFGYDIRDRQRVLRVLRRARLVERIGAGQDPRIRIKGSAWLRRLLPSLIRSSPPSVDRRQ